MTQSRAPELVGWSYAFGPFKLFPDRQLLQRDGEPVRIGGRALEILTVLVRRAGELVTKGDLTQCVWPDTFVHESNLKVNVAALRRVLGEAAPDASYVATVPGRGYRFVSRVQVQPSTSNALARPNTPGSNRGFPQPQIVIGREEEISTLADLVATSRCVTIVGPGGSGKTTVALAVAHAMSDGYRDGTFFVDLSTVGDPQYVMPAIAMALGDQFRMDDMLSGVLAALRDRQLLLVLDNCEHLAAAVATAIGHVLLGAPEVSILATSREPLRTRTEKTYRLPTLGVPDDSSSLLASQALEFPAVALFVARASQKSGYVFGDADAPTVAAICRRLDGIALAIELAAGKIIGSDPASLLDLLEQRFRLLSYGPRDAPLRHQTLLATLDWSYRLLSEDEASILRFLSLFAGYFSLDDAVALAAFTGLDATSSTDGLAQLVAKSLVAVETQHGTARYRLLESTREYAVERLVAQAEVDRAGRGHATVILALLDRAESEWFWRVKRDWMSDYATRVDDLRKSLSWAFGLNGDRQLGVRLTAAAIPLWDELSSICEARSRVDFALAAIRQMDDCGADLRVRLAAAHAWGMTFAQPIVAETEEAWLDCLQFALDAGSVEYELRGRWGFAVFLMYAGRPYEAIEQLERFKAVARLEPGASATPDGDRLLANAETYVGRISSAIERLEILILQHGQMEERPRIARFQVDRYVAIHGTLAVALWLKGETTRAINVAAQAVEGARAIGHSASQTTSLALWVLPVAFWSGDYALAAQYQVELDKSNQRESIAIWVPVSRFFRGAIQVARGERGGLGDMRGGLAELIAGRFLGRTPMFRSMLAEALLADGEIEEAKANAEAAILAAESQGERWCLPEVMRVRGLVDLQLDQAASGEAFLAEALTEAREIGALSLELRVGLTLSDKWAGEDRVEEARCLLKGIVDRFGKDAASADLAKAHDQLRTLDERLASQLRA